MSRGKRIFVTGGTGMVGSYLLRYLTQRGGNEIVALRRPTSRMDLLGKTAEQVAWVEGDLLDLPALEEAMRDADQVFHCAALVSYDPADFDRLKQVNVEGTANMVDAAMAAGIEKFVHVSSTAAIGRTMQGETLTEKKVWQRGRFNTGYAISKFLSEQEVWRAEVEGLPTAIVNPSAVLGGGRWQDGPLRLFPLVWKKFPFYPTGVNGYVDVRDVARFMVRLMESPLRGERFILSAENLPMRLVMDRIAEELDRPKPTLPFRGWMREAAWRLLWPFRRLGLSTPITRESTRIASQRFFLDNAKSLQAFPDFAYTPVDRTLEATAAAFRRSAAEGSASRVLPLLPF